MPPRFYLAPLLALLVLSWPGTIAAQDSNADPAAAAAEQARQAAERAAAPLQPRFVPAEPGYAGCENEPPKDQRIQATVPPGFEPTPGMNGGPGWLVSAPRAPIRAGASAALSLRDKLGKLLRILTVEVVAPGGSRAAIDKALVWANSADVAYPGDFAGSSTDEPGAYTVIWRSKADGRFIACDGFVVER